MERVTIIHGLNKVELKALADNFVHSIVTDPPYELSNDGKTSPNRILFEFIFPEKDKTKTISDSVIPLDFFLRDIFYLCFGRSVPTVSATVPEISMTFQKNIIIGQKIIECKDIATGFTPNFNLRDTIDLKNVQGFTNGYFELTDLSKITEVVNTIGSGFFSGNIGIGFRINQSCFPSLFTCLSSIILTDEDIRIFTDSFTKFIHTGGRAEDFFMATFDLRGGSIKFTSAYAALIFFAIMKFIGAKFITTFPTTSSLPAVFQSGSIGLIDSAANGTFSINLIVHTANIQTSGFMGKEWDGNKIAFDVDLWKECYRVIRPGGYLLAFGGTRTYHRMVCAIEDAGFEIKDQIQWIYGQGFPKSLNIGKEVDKLQGNERELLKTLPAGTGPLKNGHANKGGGGGFICDERSPELQVTKGNSEFEGWGTALKPANEPICVARKPISEKTIALNVLKWGTGGINIDGCRIGFIDDKDFDSATFGRGTDILGGNYVGATHSSGKTNIEANALGRFPANVIMDEEAGRLLDMQAPKTGACAPVRSGHNGKSKGIYGDYDQKGDDGRSFHDGRQAGASRFFYCAKASKSERNKGLGEIILDGLEITIYLCENNKDIEIWKDKITIREDRKVRRWEDMEISARKAIAEFGIQTKNDSDLNTISFGNKILEKSLMDTNFIIKTKINSTTIQQILNLLRHYTISESTQDAFSKMMDGGNLAVNVENSNILTITINEKMGFLLGVNPVVLKMQFQINEKESNNFHSTVKPIALMQYLCKLITPKNGTVLDPFMGSGSTGIGAKLESFNFIGIEREEEYCKIAQARIEAWEPEPETKPFAVQQTLFDIP